MSFVGKKEILAKCRGVQIGRCYLYSIASVLYIQTEVHVFLVLITHKWGTVNELRSAQKGRKIKLKQK